MSDYKYLKRYGFNGYGRSSEMFTKSAHKKKAWEGGLLSIK